MFCNSWCNNNSTNFNNNSCGCNRCNSCGCGCHRNNYGCRNNCCGCHQCCGCNQRTNGGCGWYSCPCSDNNFFWLPSTVTNQVPPTTPIFINLGYFTNPNATAITADAVIPVSLTKQIGLQIASSGTGALLPTGLYEISYSLSATPTADSNQASGLVSVGLKLNGVTLPEFTQSANATSPNIPYNLSYRGILDVTAPNSILTLNNISVNAQNFADVNLVARKLA